MGWPDQFLMTMGAIRFEDAVIGFLALRIVTSRREESHTLLFDACDRYAQQAIDYLGRQSWVHFTVAGQDGRVLAFQACTNIFQNRRAEYGPRAAHAGEAARSSTGYDQKTARRDRCYGGKTN
jgi:hypothetical protein